MRVECAKSAFSLSLLPYSVAEQQKFQRKMEYGMGGSVSRERESRRVNNRTQTQTVLVPYPVLTSKLNYNGVLHYVSYLPI